MSKNSRYRSDYRADERIELEIERDDRTPLQFIDEIAMNIPKEYIATQPDKSFMMVFYQHEDGKIFRKHFDRCIRAGYEPIYRNEHPSLRHNSIVGPWGKDKEDDQEMYVIDGHVGLKRDKKITEAEYIHFNRKSQALDSQAQQFNNDQGLQVNLDDRFESIPYH